MYYLQMKQFYLPKHICSPSEWLQQDSFRITHRDDIFYGSTNMIISLCKYVRFVYIKIPTTVSGPWFLV